MATGFTKNFVVKNGITTGNITLDAGTGNITGTNLSVTGISNLGAIANVIITGGSNGQAIVTDGNGNLSFANASSQSSPAPMPTYIASGDTVTISANYQGLFGYPITIDGTMTVDGILIDVNDNRNSSSGTATALNANIANVSISGGSAGYYLQTDGVGTLTWAAGAGGGGSPGGSNTQIQFNDAGSFGGNSGLTFNKTTGLLSITGNVTGGNINTAGMISTTGNANIGNAINVTGNVVGTGSVNSFGDLVNNATFNINATRSLNLIGNSAVMRVARTTTTGNPAVELLGLDPTTGAINDWWDFYTGSDTFNLRRRTGGAANLLMTASTTGVNFPTGDVSATGNVTSANILTAGNVTASRLISNIATGTAPFVVTSTTQVANLAVATAGTVTTAAQPNITSVGTLTALTINGNLAVNNVAVTGNIVPSSNNTYSLGSASSYWKDAFIGPGSLYINGVKVLEEASNSIVVSADLNQTVKVSASGSGDVQLQTTGTGVIAVKGPLQIQAANYITSSNGGPIGFSNPINVDTISSLSANTNLTISANGTGNIQINDDVTITGNLNINGGGGNLSVSSLSVEDNIIDVSAETTGTPVNNAGLRVIRGDDPSVQNRWNETTDTWQITNDGSTYLNIVGANTSTGNANVGNIGATGGIFTTVTGSLTTAAQPNITSTGTLASLSVTGNANTGNIGTGNLVTTGTGSFGANVNMNSNWITNVGYPSSNNDAATKQYVDTMISSGISYHAPVNVATTTTLAVATGGTTTYNSPNGAANGIGAYISTTGTFLNIDGANVQTAGTRILVKNEANAAWNGVYVYSNTTAITRSTDADEYGPDSTSALSVNDYFFTLGGTTNEGTAFIVSAPTGTITFGTSNITFATFSSSQVYDAGTGLTLTGTSFSVNASQTQITAVGTLTSLSVTGNANVGNIGATSGVFTNVSGNGSALTSITGANVTGQVTYAATANAVAGGNVSGQVTYAATANAVAGANVSGAVSYATTANSVAGANVTGSVNLATYATTANAVALANVSGAGNIASINLNGNSSQILYGNGVFASAPVSYGNSNVATFLASYGSNTITTTGNVSVGNIIGNGQALTGLAGGNVSGQVGNALVAGTVYTAAQGNITSVGTLTSLSVSGNATVGNLSTAGTVTAGTLTETSSIVLKENFRPIENPLEKVLQLLGQIYDRKDGSSKDEAGLVAEDVYKIIPNLVKTDINGNPESVFYSRLSVYLLESIKVLKDEIDDLKGNKSKSKK